MRWRGCRWLSFGGQRAGGKHPVIDDILESLRIIRDAVRIPVGIMLVLTALLAYLLTYLGRS